MTEHYFDNVDPICYEGPQSDNPLAFRFYDKNRIVLGKSMQEHLRFAVCYWHSFCWQGNDVFGAGTFDRPWHRAGDPMAMARLKADVAFDFFTKLGVPYYCFHDTDIAPEGRDLRETLGNVRHMAEYLQQKMSQTGMQLLWGTANCFSHPRYAAGAATNPDPEVFACAAAQVSNAMNITHAMGGQNYVLWGGREGYETLLNTDLKQERQQLGRFMQLVAEHKHKIGFDGALLIEPKPQEPTKHQYDYDTATVFGFLKEFGLENEIRVNIEVNHATLAGHSFHHEVATALSLGILGSIDANRGDPQLGWDTDQFPNSVEEMVLPVYEILKAGGLTSGGFNFDTKLRRQSLDSMDLFYGHIGGMDTVAKALLIAAEMVEQGYLAAVIEQRYAGWQKPFGVDVLEGQMELAALHDLLVRQNLDPQPVSAQQEHLENLINRYIY